MREEYALSEWSTENASLRRLGWPAQMLTRIVKMLDLARLVCSILATFTTFSHQPPSSLPLLSVFLSPAQNSSSCLGSTDYICMLYTYCCYQNFFLSSSVRFLSVVICELHKSSPRLLSVSNPWSAISYNTLDQFGLLLVSIFSYSKSYTLTGTIQFCLFFCYQLFKCWTTVLPYWCFCNAATKNCTM